MDRWTNWWTEKENVWSVRELNSSLGSLGWARNRIHLYTGVAAWDSHGQTDGKKIKGLLRRQKGESDT